MSLDVAALAKELHSARANRQETDPITDRFELLESDAYRIQLEGLALRESDGEQVIGGKLGFTSRAMREAMGVETPNYGWLTDAMVSHDGVIRLDELIHPKVEPEIAFLLADDLDTEATAEDVLAATAGITAALEVVDSRFRNFEFRPEDNIADNSSAAKVVIGDRLCSSAGINLRTIGAVVSVNGSVVFTASGAAVMDHPAEAVAWMARAARGRGLRKGDIVISGGLTSPVTLQEGMIVRVEIDRIGSATLVAR
jgi:2-keto-4-pentenoate hydratase